MSESRDNSDFPLLLIAVILLVVGSKGCDEMDHHHELHHQEVQQNPEP